MTKLNAISWFEVPVLDMERAMKFYESMLGVQLSRQQFDDLDMAWFPWDENAQGASGCLIKHMEHYKPSADGTLIYFNSQSGDLNVELGRVENAGGKIISPKKQISEQHGYMALIMDPEGNRIALHSDK